MSSRLHLHSWQKRAAEYRSLTPFTLSGKQFDPVEHRCTFGVSYLFFHDDCGGLREIAAVWTDFVKGDAWVEVAAGRSTLHAEYLLELADWVQRRAREEFFHPQDLDHPPSRRKQ